jgi:hypothetical protein
MPGRGYSGQQPDGNPLDGNVGEKISEKIKAELLSALRLLFKSAEQYTVNLTLPCALTVYNTDIACVDESADVQPPTPAYSDNVIQALQEQQIIQKQLDLLETATLAESAPCAWEPVLCSEPVFATMQFNAQPIPIPNWAENLPLICPIQPITAQIKNKTLKDWNKPRLNERLQFKALSTQSRNLSNCVLQAKVIHSGQKSNRFYTLPIRKAAIPPHRFSTAIREQFRMLLAEKANTSAGNVQLKMIYERLNMELYDHVQVDESGNLMATPKLTSKIDTLKPDASNSNGASYLVVGLQLDTKTDIRALIPVDSLQEASTGGETGT